MFSHKVTIKSFSIEGGTLLNLLYFFAKACVTGTENFKFESKNIQGCHS